MLPSVKSVIKVAYGNVNICCDIVTCMIHVKHVAIIPDGNRRWAKEHNLPAILGHEKGYERVRECVSTAREMGVAFVSVWAFSTENWKRKEEEIDDLMGLVSKGLSKIHEDAKKEKTRVVHIGRRDRISKKLLSLIEEVEEETKIYNGFCLCIAIDYGGEDEVERAHMRAIAYGDTIVVNEKYEAKKLSDFLDTTIQGVPSPDLIIRTGGETRTSGFMLMQSAYSEWVFEEKLFPDFDVVAFKKAINEYGTRVRRLGE